MKLTTVKGLWIGFGILILSLILASFLIDHNIRSIGRVVGLESMSSASFGMEINVLGMGLSTLKYLDTGDPDQRERVVDDAGDYERYKVTYDAAARSDLEKESSERMNVLFAEYREVSETLMNSSDEQRALLAQIADAWEQIDTIIDERLQPGIDRRNYQGLEKVEAAANVEADVAEVATWVATYLQNPRSPYRDRIRESEAEARTDLADLRTLSLTAEKRRLVAAIGSVFDQAMSRVKRILELNDLLLDKRKRFIELRDKLDDVLDDEIQVTVTANMVSAKAEAEQTVLYLRVTGFVLLVIGIAITTAAMYLMIRRSRQLESSNRALKTEIVERERGEVQLRRSSEQLRALSAHLLSVREEERTRIARAVHDELGQLLTAMIIDLSWLEEKLSGVNGAATDRLVGKVRSLLKLSDTTVDTVRRIATELRTGLLDGFGLTAAVEQQILEFQDRTGIRCDFVANLDETDLNPAYSSAVFYIFQEAMTNVARHAAATSVSKVLEESEGELILQVEDNGKGVTEDSLGNTLSLGVVGMRERAVILGGGVEVKKGVRGKGTRVTARIPRNSGAQASLIA